jgi:ATP-dependent DNA helicase DinG
VDEIAAVLGPGGRLSRALAGYEHRPEQLTLAREVARAFDERRMLVAEAGTGTGKTLAYLVPAILSGRRVVVSTATKNLQDQLFHKDLPLVRDTLGLPVRATLVKGRANYLCLHKLERARTGALLDSREEADAFAMLLRWAERTETGDRAELMLPEGFGGWRQVSTTPDGCLGTRCPQHSACFVTRLRQQAEESELVVVNHALFFADLVVRTGRGGGEGVLPRYEAVIFDEAHGLEDAATEFFGTTVSSHRFEELARDAQAALPLEDSRAGVLSALAVKVRAEADALWAAAPRAVGMTDEGTVRLTARAFEPLGRQLQAVLEGLGALGGFASGHEEADLLALARRASELGAELDFVRRADAPDHVYWAEGRGRGLFLRAAPISVAEAMRERLYGSVDTVVFTSATLRTGTSFEYFCRQVGLLDDAGEAVVPLTQLAVPSSFDYASQSALYLPSALPEPREPGFAEAVAEEIARLVEVTGGRAFALFTSLRNMERVHALLSRRLPYPMLLQGEAPKPVLLDAFQSTPSVLFASASFWEGVDVPGDALSLVILDKLPFAAPTHPVVAARIEALEKAGREPFSSYQLPEAALALRQGFGRLIRTRTDRGIVALLDVRVGRKAYGRQLLAGLPPARRFRELGPLADWFRSTASMPRP